MTLPVTFIYTRGCTAHQLGNNSHYVDLDYKIANWYSRCSLKRILNVSQHSLKLNIEPRLLMKFLRRFSLFIILTCIDSTPMVAPSYLRVS